MDNTNELINKIIPPNDYIHRNGFTNYNIIDDLTNDQRKSVEDGLINKLEETKDILVIEVLSYMKSTKALPFLYKLLTNTNDHMIIIIIATSIFIICKDVTMIDFVKKHFPLLNNKYQIIQAFYYLNKFRESEIDHLIKVYLNDKDFLISYNAKRSLKKNF